MALSFTDPGFLWALPLAGIPWALHWWGRGRSPRFEFSAVAFLQSASRKRLSWEQLRRWLLLCARTLLLMSLVVFLAGPLFQGAIGGGGKGVVLLDASYSLQASWAGGTAFDRARDLALALLDDRRPGDQWGVVVFSDRVESFSPVQHDPDPARAMVQSARVTWRGTNTAVALARATELLSGTGVVVLLSDMARHGWNEALSPGRGPAVLVEVVPERPNAAFVGVDTRPDTAEAIARRWGFDGLRAWRLIGQGRTLAQGSVNWSGSQGRAQARLLADPGGSQFAMDPDSLPVDDHFYFVPRSPRRYSLLMVNGAPGLSPVGDETWFIRKVIDAWAEEGLQAGEASPRDLDNPLPTRWDAVALLNPPPLSARALTNLRDYVKSGGGLWVTAGDRGGAPSLSELLPVQPTGVEEINDGLVLSGDGDFAELKGFEWDRVHVHRATVGDPKPGSRAVLSGRSSGRGLCVLGAVGSGRTCFWASTVDRDWTNLPSKPAYPVWVRFIVTRIARPETDPAPLFRWVDEPLRHPTGGGPWDVVRPDGRVDRVHSADSFYYEHTDRPGLYTVRTPRGHFMTGAVNPDTRSEEGDLSRLSVDTARLKWGGAHPVHFISADRANRVEIGRALRGHNLTPLAGALALLFFLCESALLWTRRKRNY